MSERRRIPEVTPAGRAAAQALRGRVAGEVRTSPLARWLYSTDASIYRVVPDAVVVAASPDDLAAVAAVAREYGVPIVARGSATSVSGQAIGPGIAVDCFRLDRILAIDPEARSARVQPGVVQASLNRAAAAHGLEFGPDTSTVDQATIGGMVGNNSSGSRSIVYGETKDKVLAVSAVLAGGDLCAFGRCSGGDLASGLRGPGAGRLAAALAGIREQYRRPIAEGYPQTRRCTSGYHLRPLLEPEPELARLLAGSEGTLALFTELEVALDPRPARRAGAALTFATLRRALDANVAILETGPSAIELLDLEPLRAAPNLKAYARMASLLAGSERAMLTVEYQGSEDEAREGLGRLRAAVAGLGADRVEWLEEPAALAEAAALRRAALPLLMGAPGAERPASFVEDTAVAPERLAEFVAEFEALVRAHGARASFTGHASAGCLHVRPLLDLKSAAGVATMRELADSVGDLVASYHGAISGEHGCGRSRSWLLPRILGPGLYDAMVALKDAFDPERLLGPGTIVDGPGVAEDLRFGPDYRGDGAWTPRLSFSAEGGFGAAIEKCFGAGLCKKSSGTMCPPAAASRDEARTTRARANALQGVLSGAVPLAAVAEDEFREVLGTCVACKACKSECPAGVDMAALKVEWLAEVRSREGVPALARGIGEFRALARLAAPLAPLVNGVARTPLARLVTDRAGVAHARPLPAFARRPLTRRLRGAPRAAARGVVRRLLRAVPGAAHRRSSGAAPRRGRRRAGADRRRLLRAHGALDRPDRQGARRCAPGLDGSREAGVRRRGRAVHRAQLPLDDQGRLGPAAARRRARPAGRRRFGAGARSRRSPRGSRPPALSWRRPRRAARPLPRQGAGIRGGDAARARRGARSGARGAGRRLLRHVRRVRLRGGPLRAERRDGRARAAAGRPRGAGRNAGPRHRHVVPLADPRPFRPPRAPSSRVPGAEDRGAGMNALILIAGIVGLAVAGYGLIALSTDAWRRRQYLDIALGVGVAVAVVVLLVLYGDSLLR